MSNHFEPVRRPVPAPRGAFVQTFGIDVRVAVLAIIVDTMAFSATIVSAGLLYPVELLGAAMLALITYKIQRYWYGDSHQSALIKALIIGLVTAIPTSISSYLVAGPAGFVGLIHMFQKSRE